MQDEVKGVERYTVDADDYAEELERAMRTVKEEIRELVQGFPFRRKPRLTVKRNVEVATRNLNSFPAENRTSEALSPLTIATGGPPPDARSHPFDFGVHTKVIKDNG